MENKKVIIIGAGVIGCAIAFELARRGYQTLNLDKNSDVGSGSTVNSSAIVRAHYSTYDGVALAYEAFKYWADWKNYIEAEDERGLARFMNTGTILIKSPGIDYQRVLKLYREIGVEHEEWDIETLKEKIPIYSPLAYWPPSRPEDDSFWEESEKMIEGAIYTSGSGYVNDPQLVAHNLMRAAEAYGGKFRFNCTVTDVHQDNDRVSGVRLENGETIEAPIVVNAAGPHSYQINRMAGIEESMNIKTKPLRQEVHHVPAPAGFDFEKNGFHTSDGDNGIYFRPEVGNTILVGSEEPDCDPHEWIDDPDDFNRYPTEAQWKAQVYRLARRIPNLPIPNQPRGVADLYDVSDDWIPIYDSSDLDGFYLAIGTSGNQFKNAPAVGHLMAELIEAVEKGQDHDTDPTKYQGRYTKLPINIGFFSRQRKIVSDSSFSVNG